MKSITYILVSTLLIFAATPALLRGQEINPDADREIIVMFQKDVVQLPETTLSAELDKISISSTELRSVLDTHFVDRVQKAFPNFNSSDTLKVTAEGLVVKSPDLTQVFKIRLPIDQDRAKAIDDLKRLPEVIYAEPNENMQPRLIPNDPYLGRQWNMRDTGQYGGIPGADIHATEAWDIWQGTFTVLVAIVDWGVNPNHIDLYTRVTGDTGSSDHATHVAGIAAGTGNNSSGIAGVDWHCYINSQIGGDVTTGAAAIRAAVDAGARIINDSWGQVSYHFFVTLASAFAYAYKLNAISCVAMPEYGSYSDYPSKYGQGILNVGATTNQDRRAWYSYAKPYIDVVAPGGNYDEVNERNIYSTVPGGWAYMAGTSMAAPLATGVASLLKGYANINFGINLYNDDLKQILRISADDIDDSLDATTGPGWDQGTGTGRINARKALEYLQFPYSLVQLNIPQGWDNGYENVDMTFYDTPGLGPGESFPAQRHEIRQHVDFIHPFVSPPYVWGRGVATTGYSYSPNDTNFGTGFCDAVPGTVTTTGCNLYTYAYYRPSNGTWFPCNFVGINFFYTLLGEYRLYEDAIRSAQSSSPYISVGWNDAYANEGGYKLERKDATSNQWAIIRTSGPDTTSYLDYNPRGSETYTYKVRGYSGTKYGTYSNEKVIKARPNPPSDFEAMVECVIYGPKGCQTRSNTVFLFWSPPANQKLPISYYRIRIQQWGGPTTYHGPVYGQEDTLCLETNKNYYLYVFSVDSAGDSSNYTPAQHVMTGSWDDCSGPQQKPVVFVPGNFFLDQNYPNPFNLQTEIRYGLPQDARVKLVIYNILGEKVRVLVDEYQPAGERNVVWDGKNDNGDVVASGIYLYRLEAGSFTKTAKMSLLK